MANARQEAKEGETGEEMVEGQQATAAADSPATEHAGKTDEPSKAP